MPSLFTELKRRNVYRVGVAYIIVAWVIAQVLDLVADNVGAPEWAMQLMLAILGLGLPVALILAWAYELTPEGVKRTEDVPPAESITPRTGRKLNRITMAALVLVLAFIGWDKLGPARDATDDVVVEKSVAVLPFADLSQNRDQEWLADGLTEELLNALARLPELKVTARTSSFEFKNTNTDISEIAEQLGVAHVVEGSIRRIGDDLRVTAQLIRALDGFHLWSDTYDRKTDDLFDVQLDVAENIASTLQVVMDEDARRRMLASGTRNVAAFRAFMEGRELYEKAHSRATTAQVSLEEANIVLERAMQLDPTFAQPAMLHADRFAHQLYEPGSRIVGNTEGLDADTAYTLYRQDLDFVVKQAPDRAWRIVAEINREWLAPTWYRLPELIQQLGELQSDGEPIPLESVWLMEVLRLTGNTDIGEALARHSKEADPLSVVPWEDLAEILLCRGQLDESLALLEEVRLKFGDNDRLRERRVTHALVRGDNPAALDVLERGFDFIDAFNYLDPLMAALQGNRDEALRLAGAFEAHVGWPHFGLIDTYSLLSEEEKLRDLVTRVDQMPAGAMILGTHIASSGCTLLFDLDDTPNFRQRLAEARVDPASFQTRTWDTSQ